MLAEIISDQRGRIFGSNLLFFCTKYWRKFLARKMHILLTAYKKPILAFLSQENSYKNAKKRRINKNELFDHSTDKILKMPHRIRTIEKSDLLCFKKLMIIKIIHLI